MTDTPEQSDKPANQESAAANSEVSELQKAQEQADKFKNEIKG